MCPRAPSGLWQHPVVLHSLKKPCAGSSLSGNARRPAQTCDLCTREGLGVARALTFNTVYRPIELEGREPLLPLQGTRLSQRQGKGDGTVTTALRPPFPRLQDRLAVPPLEVALRGARSGLAHSPWWHQLLSSKEHLKTERRPLFQTYRVSKKQQQTAVSPGLAVSS